MARKKKSGRPVGSKTTLSPEEFVHLWQTAEDMSDFINKSGMTRRAATGRAVYYRQNGVPLRQMTRGRPPLDFAALADIARQRA